VRVGRVGGVEGLLNRPALVDGLIPREGGFMSAPWKYPEELRERAKRMVAEAWE